MKAFASVLAALFAANAASAAPLKTVDAPIKLPLNPVVAATKQKCTVARPSGLAVKELKKGEGAAPLPGDVVLVNYIGYFRSNGEVFDQSTESAFPVDAVVPGFAEGLMLMNRGSIFRLCLPAALGYGAEGTPDGTIPPNADIGFQVELIDFKSQAEIEAMRTAQETTSPETPETTEAPPQNP